MITMMMVMAYVRLSHKAVLDFYTDPLRDKMTQHAHSGITPPPLPQQPKL